MPKVGATRKKPGPPNAGKTQIYTAQGWRLASRVKENRPKLYKKAMGGGKKDDKKPAGNEPDWGAEDYADDMPVWGETYDDSEFGGGQIPPWMQNGFTAQSLPGAQHKPTHYSKKQILNQINKVFGTSYGSFEEAMKALELPLQMAGLAKWNMNTSRGGTPPKELWNTSMGSIFTDQQAYGLFIGRIFETNKAGSMANDLKYWQSVTPDWLYDAKERFDENYNNQNGDPSSMWNRFDVSLLAGMDLNSNAPIGDAASSPHLLGLTGLQAGSMGLYAGMTPEEFVNFVMPHYNAYYHRPAGAPVPEGYEAGLKKGGVHSYVDEDGNYIHLRSPITSIPMYHEYMNKVGGSATRNEDVAPGSWQSTMDASMMDAASDLYWDGLHFDAPYWNRNARYGPTYTPGANNVDLYGYMGEQTVFDWDQFYPNWDYSGKNTRIPEWNAQVQEFIAQTVEENKRKAALNRPQPKPPTLPYGGYGYGAFGNPGSYMQAPMGNPAPNYGLGQFMY